MDQKQSDQVFLGHHKVDGVSSDKKRQIDGEGRWTVALKAWAHLARSSSEGSDLFQTKKGKIKQLPFFIFPCYKCAGSEYARKKKLCWANRKKLCGPLELTAKQSLPLVNFQQMWRCTDHVENNASFSLKNWAYFPQCLKLYADVISMTKVNVLTFVPFLAVRFDSLLRTPLSHSQAGPKNPH